MSETSRSRPFIFSRSYRTQGERAMDREVGLGLAITTGHVEAHGGTIVVDPKVRAGTQFTTVLPWEDSA